MEFFKILLIILVSAPVIAVAVYLYYQILGYIRARNRAENSRRQR